MTGHRIDTALGAATFALAGNARFTVVSPATGTRYTYRVSLADGDRGPR